MSPLGRFLFIIVAIATKHPFRRDTREGSLAQLEQRSSFCRVGSTFQEPGIKNS